MRTLDLVGHAGHDAGLEHLKGADNVAGARPRATKVTDAGLEHLKGLTGLQDLDLSYTKVTDAGVVHLKKSLPNVFVVTR